MFYAPKRGGLPAALEKQRKPGLAALRPASG